jgi:acetylornithine deacetylase/succinyl-diaminopimelate desuccinylase-like protein
MSGEDQADAWRAELSRVLPSVRGDLEELVRIRSVSADPAAINDIRRSADLVARLLRDTGLADAEVVSVADGQPAVLAHRPAPPGAPTVLLYAHHDVQPEGDRSAWDSDPFEPQERGGRLYGRGAADDKAGIALHLAALRVLGDDLGVGVTVIVEGEEETGSPTLPAFLERYRERLAADVIVLADSMNWRIGVPALTTSLRGGVNVTVEVSTLDHAVHNGLYGGPVPDALTALARLIATLHDEKGDVAVAGLTRGSSDPLDLTSRLWTGPAISVIGIDAPAVDSASMMLVPRARARLTLRVGPADDAAAAGAALVAHLESHAPWGARVTATAGKAVHPFAATTSGPAYVAARAAFEQAWQASPVEVGVGGSIDFISSFAEAFPEAEILITGVEDPDTRAHGANESLHLADFERACLAEVLLLAKLASRHDA